MNFGIVLLIATVLARRGSRRNHRRNRNVSNCNNSDCCDDSPCCYNEECCENEHGRRKGRCCLTEGNKLKTSSLKIGHKEDCKDKNCKGCKEDCNDVNCKDCGIKNKSKKCDDVNCEDCKEGDKKDCNDINCKGCSLKGNTEKCDCKDGSCDVCKDEKKSNKKDKVQIEEEE